MFKTALMLGVFTAATAYAQEPFELHRIDCEVIFTLISDPALLNNAALVGLAAALEGASSATAINVVDLRSEVAALCRAEPNLSLATAIREVARR